MRAMHIGVDIGYRRDTSAVVGIYRDLDMGKFCLAFHNIWAAPVHIPDVTQYVVDRFEDESVAGVWFDPHQWAAEAQRLSDDGFGRYLNEVNQTGPYMIQAGSDMHVLMQREDFLMYDAPDLRRHFSFCAVKMTSQGPRIIKTAQTKQIDGVVAIAMALSGASQDDGFTESRQYKQADHVVELEMLI